MLEQSESEGNSVYIARTRLKHFLKTILYRKCEELYIFSITYIKDIIQYNYQDKAQRRNTIYRQTIDQVLYKNSI